MFKLFFKMALIFVSMTSFANASNFTTLNQMASKKILESNGIKFEAIKSPSDDILLSYPRGLIGQGNMFGTSIIKVSDKEDVALGNLKLAWFASLARSELINTNTKQALVFKGSFGGEGSETQPLKVLAEIPVTEVTDSTVTLNLSALGKDLDIAPMFVKHSGEEMQNFTHLGSKTVSVDFSVSTLVFDVESTYKIEATNQTTKEITSKEVMITTRWFVRLNSGMTPYFVPRKNTPGVGFFTNGESSNDYISRFAITDLATNPVKYYVKNVPLEHRPAVLAGFEDWNHKLQNTLGHNLLVYEVLETNDPRYNQIIAGDVRYNVLEWDIDNKASYGGLGPSIKHGTTGETIAGHTLIQGPEILGIYKKWFKVKEQVASLSSRGQNDRAEKLKMDFVKEISAKVNSQKNVRKYKLSFRDIELQIPSQDIRLHDALAVDPLDFYETPAGYTYENYMNGYWREIIPHELGHNLGLRHNFRGNLKDKGEGAVGSVSRSVMEYLGRGHRYLNRVSEYDIMAIAYGYLGKKPAHKDWFCTDGDQGIYSYTNSAECSNGDATSDPFSYMEGKINRGLDLLLARNTSAAPEWTIKEAAGPVGGFFLHLTAYATTAQASAEKWTNFFGKEGRPATPEEVPAYVLNRLNDLICNPELDAQAAAKDTEEGKTIAAKNLEDYRNHAFTVMKNVPAPWSIVSKQNFSCYKE